MCFPKHGDCSKKAQKKASFNFILCIVCNVSFYFRYAFNCICIILCVMLYFI